MAIFAGLALLLAAVGIYGVTSYTVGQRTQEIGLRMALGAQTRAVLRMILSQTLKLTLIGLITRGSNLTATNLIFHTCLFFGSEPNFERDLRPFQTA